MLFNSYTFIFAFLPITFFVFLLLAAKAPRPAVLLWLVVSSLFYYGWSRPKNLLLLGALLVLTYAAGVYLGRHVGKRRARLILILGLAVNLGVLAYFKYANLIVDTVNSLTRAGWPAADVILPLGISFFVFQKIAYLVDAYRGLTRGYNFLDYCLFVTFFPQLIAGPITHHSEVVPQFTRQRGYRLNLEDFNVGLTQFICGLFKKVVFADRMALYASPIFEAARNGVVPTFADAWVAALAYTFQLYFDFSGYSDMALGLARLFGIKLPQNFNSPYKATNITEFWRRWHMTLSRFLRDYLYIPLGGNRKGRFRRYANLMITMLLGGLWHGAGWTFVFWGGMQGLFLVIHRAWQTLRIRLGWPADTGKWYGHLAGRTVTFLAVVLAWVFFRAANFGTAGRILAAMAGLHGFETTSSFRYSSVITSLAALWLVVWFLPNTQDLLRRFEPALDYRPSSEMLATPARLQNWLVWRPNAIWAVLLATVAVFVFTQMSRISEFIYWQF